MTVFSSNCMILTKNWRLNINAQIQNVVARLVTFPTAILSSINSALHVVANTRTEPFRVITQAFATRCMKNLGMSEVSCYFCRIKETMDYQF